MSNTQPVRFALLAITFSLSLVVTIFIYWPGLSGPFLLDDMWNIGAMQSRGGIVNLENAQAFIFENKSGALGRPISMASFLLSDQYWPASAFSFKFHNLMLHLLNGVLAFYLAFRVFLLGKLTRDVASILALGVMVLWLLHPLNVSTVLYVVQRMTQLSALFGMLGVIFFIVGRQRLSDDRKNSVFYLGMALFFFPLLSVLSKENGIMVFAIYALVELFFFSASRNKSVKVYLVRTCIALPVLALLSYLFLKLDKFLYTYEFRSFTLYERVITQPFVLLDYLKLIVAPTGTGTGLIHDDFETRTTLFGPDWAITAVLLVCAMITAAVAIRKTYPLIGFGVLFFFGGHFLESSFVPLEMYFEHRNYLPMVGVLIALAGAVNLLFNLESTKVAVFVSSLVLVVMLFLSTLATQQSVKIWGNLFHLLTFWATEHPDSLRAQRVYGQYLGRGQEWADVGQDILADAFEKHPSDISLPIIMLNTSCKQGVESPVSMSTAFDMVNVAYYHGGLITEVKTFVNLHLLGRCANIAEPSQIHEFLDQLANIHGMRGGQKADLLYFHANVHATLGNLDAAMAKLDEAGRFQKDFVVPFKQAQILASAGLYDQALIFVQKAREWDAQRKRAWIAPGNDKIISALEREILTLKSSEQ